VILGASTPVLTSVASWIDKVGRGMKLEFSDRQPAADFRQEFMCAQNFNFVLKFPQNMSFLPQILLL